MYNHNNNNLEELVKEFVDKSEEDDPFNYNPLKESKWRLNQH
jgi:hypothetical protein